MTAKKAKPTRNPTVKKRRARLSSFGTIISVGANSRPAFQIRWWEGGNRRTQGGFKSKMEAAEALDRLRTARLEIKMEAAEAMARVRAGLPERRPVEPVRLLRLPDVIARVALGRTWIYEAVERGAFPAPIKLAPRCVVWPSDVVDAWVRAQMAQARDGRGDPR